MDKTKSRLSEAEARERFIEALEWFIDDEPNHASDPRLSGWCPINGKHKVYETGTAYQQTFPEKIFSRRLLDPWRTLLIESRRGDGFDVDMVKAAAKLLIVAVEGADVRGGPVPPDRFEWGDESIELGRKRFALLEYLWQHDEGNFDDLRLHVWKGDASDDGIRQAIRELNRAAMTLKCPRTFSTKRGVAYLDK